MRIIGKNSENYFIIFLRNTKKFAWIFYLEEKDDIQGEHKEITVTNLIFTIYL